MKFIIIDKDEAIAFDDAIDKYPVSFVRFHSPHCGHCLAMNNEMKKLDNHHKIKKHNLCVIDAHSNITGKIKHRIGKMQHNQGVPAMYLIIKDSKKKPVEYTGERTADDMANYIDEQFVNYMGGSRGGNEPAPSADPDESVGAAAEAPVAEPRAPATEDNQPAGPASASSWWPFSAGPAAGGRNRKTRKRTKTKKKGGTRKFEGKVGNSTLTRKIINGKKHAVILGENNRPIVNRNTGKVHLYNYKKAIEDKKLYRVGYMAQPNPQGGIVKKKTRKHRQKRQTHKHKHKHKHKKKGGSYGELSESSLKRMASYAKRDKKRRAKLIKLRHAKGLTRRGKPRKGTKSKRH